MRLGVPGNSSSQSAGLLSGIPAVGVADGGRGVLAGRWQKICFQSPQQAPRRSVMSPRLRLNHRIH